MFIQISLMSQALLWKGMQEKATYLRRTMSPAVHANGSVCAAGPRRFLPYPQKAGQDNARPGQIRIKVISSGIESNLRDQLTINMDAREIGMNINPEDILFVPKK